MGNWSGVAGKRVLITGATGGIGLAAAKELAARGASLAIVARAEDKARAAKALIEAAAPGKAPVDFFVADLSSLAEVRRLAAEVLARYPRLDALVNNAGAMYPERRLTPEGFELTWAVNHLSPFLLTRLLLDRLKASGPARVVTTSSGAHEGARGGIPFDDLNMERGYKGLRRYCETKLANILFTSELARRLEGSPVQASCYHPGAVATDFGRDSAFMRGFMKIFKFFLRTPEKGAETLVWLVDAPEAGVPNGSYFMDLRVKKTSAAGRDAAAARRLWDVSETQCGLHAGKQ